MAAKRTRFLGIGRLADEHHSYGAVGTALQYCCDWRRRQHRQYDQLVELRQAEPCRQPASGKSHGSTSLQPGCFLGSKPLVREFRAQCPSHEPRGQRGFLALQGLPLMEGEFQTGDPRRSLQYVQHHELWGALGTYRLAKRRPYFEPGDVAAATAVGREDRFLSSKAGAKTRLASCLVFAVLPVGSAGA